MRWADVSKTISTPKTLNPYAAELAALECAVSQILNSVRHGETGPQVTIFSDSLGALQALRDPRPKSGQFLITKITLKVHEINNSNRTQVAFERSPGHSQIPGNEQAHNLAQLATLKGTNIETPTVYHMLQSVALERKQKKLLPTPQLRVKPQTSIFAHSFIKGVLRKLHSGAIQRKITSRCKHTMSAQIGHVQTQ